MRSQRACPSVGQSVNHTCKDREQFYDHTILNNFFLLKIKDFVLELQSINQSINLFRSKMQITIVGKIVVNRIKDSP